MAGNKLTQQVPIAAKRGHTYSTMATLLCACAAQQFLCFSVACAVGAHVMCATPLYLLVEASYNLFCSTATWLLRNHLNIVAISIYHISDIHTYIRSNMLILCICYLRTSLCLFWQRDLILVPATRYLLPSDREYRMLYIPLHIPIINESHELIVRDVS